MHWLKQKPVLSYFSLAFLISWGGVFLFGSPYSMPANAEQSSGFGQPLFSPISSAQQLPV